MPRKLSAAREAEFVELSAFVDLYATEVMGKPRSDSVHPTKYVELSVSRFGKSKALERLRQAVGDIIEATSHLSPAKLAALDDLCRGRSIVTLSSLRRLYWSKYAAIMKRGAIRNDTEYYLVVGVLNDMASSIPATERSSLQRIASQYERG